MAWVPGIAEESFRGTREETSMRRWRIFYGANVGATLSRAVPGGNGEPEAVQVKVLEREIASRCPVFERTDLKVIQEQSLAAGSG